MGEGSRTLDSQDKDCSDKSWGRGDTTILKILDKYVLQFVLKWLGRLIQKLHLPQKFELRKS